MACCATLALAFLLLPQTALDIASRFTQFAISQFGLYFIILASLFLCASLVIAISPLGKIVLGADGEPPEFGFFSWIAMLFAAGMGSGLIFWGVAEPVFHYANPPTFASRAESATDMALALGAFTLGVSMPWPG